MQVLNSWMPKLSKAKCSFLYMNFLSFTVEVKEIRDALRDPELQKMILKIDGSSEPEKVSLHSSFTYENCYVWNVFENRSSPSAKKFAECNFSGTQQTIYLLSANKKTLGKNRHSANKVVCRVPRGWHSANNSFLFFLKILKIANKV